MTGVWDLVWKGLQGLVSIGGWEGAQRWGPLLGNALEMVLRERRRVALENVTLAGIPQPERTVRRMFEHFGTVVLELCLAPRAALWILHCTEFRGVDHFESARRRGRGVLLSFGHLGNWEIGALAYSKRFGPLYSVYRPLANPGLDRFVLRLRARFGVRPVPMDRATPAITAALRKGNVVVLLTDQDARRRGIFVEFFGRPASTFPAVAVLSLRTAAPVVPVGMFREGPRYVIEFAPPILPEEFRHEPERIRAFTQRIVSRLEEQVRRHPDQYFWLHRRWKTRPRAPISSPAPAAPPPSSA